MVAVCDDGRGEDTETQVREAYVVHGRTKTDSTCLAVRDLRTALMAAASMEEAGYVAAIYDVLGRRIVRQRLAELKAADDPITPPDAMSEDVRRAYVNIHRHILLLEHLRQSQAHERETELSLVFFADALRIMLASLS